MPVPGAIADLSTTPASNSPPGGEAIGTNLDDYVRAAFAFIAQLRDGKASLGANDFTGIQRVVMPNGQEPSVSIMQTAQRQWRFRIPAGQAHLTLSDVDGGIDVMHFRAGTGAVGVGIAAASIAARFHMAFPGATLNGMRIDDTDAGGTPRLIQVTKAGLGEIFFVDHTGKAGAIEFIATKVGGGQVFGATNGLDSDFYMSLSAAGAPSKEVTLGPSTNTHMYFRTNNLLRWVLNSAGTFHPTVDANFNLGDPGARIANLYSVNAAFSNIPTAGGVELGYMGLPVSSQVSGAITRVGSRGSQVLATGGCSFANSNWEAGDVVVVNNRSAGPIALSFSGIPCEWIGTGGTIGDRTLAVGGEATIRRISGRFLISGVGLS